MTNPESSHYKTTIVFPVVQSQILLGMKKRGFGQGWWNGFGGKLDAGETYEDCAKRECQEEAGIEVGRLVHVANLHFFFDNILKVVSKAYVSDGFIGVPGESEEMRPELFEIGDIPYDTMWAADRIWIPKALGDISEPIGFIVKFVGTDVESVEEVNYRMLEGEF